MVFWMRSDGLVKVCGCLMLSGSYFHIFSLENTDARFEVLDEYEVCAERMLINENGWEWKILTRKYRRKEHLL